MVPLHKQNIFKTESIFGQCCIYMYIYYTAVVLKQVRWRVLCHLSGEKKYLDNQSLVAT